MFLMCRHHFQVKGQNYHTLKQPFSFIQRLGQDWKSLHKHLTIEHERSLCTPVLHLGMEDENSFHGSKSLKVLTAEWPTAISG